MSHVSGFRGSGVQGLRGKVRVRVKLNKKALVSLSHRTRLIADDLLQTAAPASESRTASTPHATGSSASSAYALEKYMHP